VAVSACVPRLRERIQSRPPIDDQTFFEFAATLDVSFARSPRHAGRH
jgi:hypothetical protein